MQKDIPLSKIELENLAGWRGEGLNRSIISIIFSGFRYDPGLITERLILNPSRSGIAGESYLIGGFNIERTYDENYWKYSEEFVVTDYIGDIAESFIQRIIEPRVSQLEIIAKKCYGEFSIIQYYTQSNNPGFHLSKESIRKISDSNLDIDIDIYDLFDNE